jgi:manganese transport protein
VIDRLRAFFTDRLDTKPVLGALEILRYIGPGLLVTVGFIDPGNWASNVAAGSQFGYLLLWMVTLSTLMLVILQHNVAHLGIVTGLCLSEAATVHLPKRISRTALFTAVLASISTALAEILGAAVGLQMLFNIPIPAGAVISACVVLWMLFSSHYRKIEKWIIGFVSLIGLSFLYEIALVRIDWRAALHSWFVPSIPEGSMLIVMSVLGAVVMPHNLFLHSEIIQSRQWNLEDDSLIKRQLKYEFTDTLLSMLIGWAINSAMILLAAAAFHSQHRVVNEISDAQRMLTPLLGNLASFVFAFALLCAGVSSSVTAGMAGGSIFAGIYGEPYDIRDGHTRRGVAITIIAALLVIFLISAPFKGLLISQMLLSIQLPVTIVLQIYLTSSKKVMGKYANTVREKILLWTVALAVISLNVLLFASFFR